MNEAIMIGTLAQAEERLSSRGEGGRGTYRWSRCNSMMAVGGVTRAVTLRQNSEYSVSKINTQNDWRTANINKTHNKTHNWHDYITNVRLYGINFQHKPGGKYIVGPRVIFEGLYILAFLKLSKNIVIMKSGSEITQGHSNGCHSIDCVWFPSSVL